MVAVPVDRAVGTRQHQLPRLPGKVGNPTRIPAEVAARRERTGALALLAATAVRAQMVIPLAAVRGVAAEGQPRRGLRQGVMAAQAARMVVAEAVAV